MIQEKLTTTTMSTILSRIQMETIQPLPTTPIAHQNRCLTEEQMQMHGRKKIKKIFERSEKII